MARRQKSRPRPAASAVQMPTSPVTPKPERAGASEPPENGREPARLPAISGRLLLLALGAGLVWIGVLAVLAIVTANPVTLNREQIRTADAVITARVLDISKGTVEVERVWTGRRNLGGENLTLVNLRQTGVESGETYLVPVSHVRARRYEVTGTRLPGQKPLVYPATDEAVSQLRDVLAAEGNASDDEQGGP